jgi:hypothetical protein
MGNNSQKTPKQHNNGVEWSKADKWEQQCMEITQIGEELIESSQNQLDDGVNDKDAYTIVWNAYMLCRVIGNDHTLVEAWLIDAIAMELDNMHDESASGIKTMLKSIATMMKWVECIKTM